MYTTLTEILLVLMGFVFGIAFTGFPEFQVLMALFVALYDRLRFVSAPLAVGIVAGTLFRLARK